MKICVLGSDLTANTVSEGLAKVGHDIVKLGDDAIDKVVKDVKFLIVAHDIDESMNLSQLWGDFGICAPYLEKGCTVIVNSQVPVGTCHQLKEEIPSEKEINVAYVIENLKVNDAMNRFFNPDFLVFGVDNPDTETKLKLLYEFLDREIPFISLPIREAEMFKHVLNSFLATQISFANEIGEICNSWGLDGEKVLDALKCDPRVGKIAPIRPGSPFTGGHLERGLKAVQRMAQEKDIPTNVLSGVFEVNRGMVSTALKSYIDTQLNNSIQGLKLYGKDDIENTVKRLENARDKLDEIR